MVSESPLPTKMGNGAIANGEALEALDLNVAAAADAGTNGNGQVDVPPPTEQMKEFLETEKV